MKALLCCAICAMCLGSALAYSGSDYLTACNLFLRARRGEAASSATLNIGICMGYTSGVLETAEVFGSLGTRLSCVPEAAENEQIIRVIVKYLEDNPQNLHRRAASLIQLALLQAFPCTEGN